MAARITFAALSAEYLETIIVQRRDFDDATMGSAIPIPFGVYIRPTVVLCCSMTPNPTRLDTIFQIILQGKYMEVSCSSVWEYFINGNLGILNLETTFLQWF